MAAKKKPAQLTEEQETGRWNAYLRERMRKQREKGAQNAITTDREQGSGN